MITPEQANALAEQLLTGVRTRLGGLAIEHARRVAAVVADHGDGAVIAGLLHDTVEKRCIGWPELALAVDDQEIVRAIDALTHRASEPYTDYLRRCAEDPVAAPVKRADLLDKLGPEAVGIPADIFHDVRGEARARLALLDGLLAETEASGILRPEP